MAMTFNVKGSLPTGGETLCKTCRWVHMQRGFRESEEAIFCNFASLRAVKFKVAECTDFESRVVPQEWQLEKLALIINSEPARKKAGFNRGFLSDLPEDEESPPSGEDE